MDRSLPINRAPTRTLTPTLALALTVVTGAFVLGARDAGAGEWDGVFVGAHVGMARFNSHYQTGPDDLNWFKNMDETAGMWANGDQNDDASRLMAGVSLAYNRQVGAFVLGAELGVNAMKASIFSTIIPAAANTPPNAVNPSSRSAGRRASPIGICCATTSC